MYTSTVKYLKPVVLDDVAPIRFSVDTRAQLCTDPDNPIYARAHLDFSQRLYMYPSPPVFMGAVSPELPAEDIYVLRLLLKQPGSTFVLPARLGFLEAFVRHFAAYQAAFFPAFDERFVYLTVRHGAVLTSRDDEFHADGFQGASIPRHIPEQNYLWADTLPTLFSIQPYFIEDLDPAKHNVHSFFDRHTNRGALYSGIEGGVYLIDPYHVHARQKAAADIARRTVVRLTFSPVEIRDDTNTPNPFLPREPYNRHDVRNALWDYPWADPELKFGLRPYPAFA